MKTIRKYHLQPNKHQTIKLPTGSRILGVDAKGEDTPVLWALVDPEKDTELKSLALYATGTELPDDPGHYLGSFQLFDGTLEFHAFEEQTLSTQE
ncbi:DUF7352 domain-containing protein [Desulfogranum japonicum]|uniref:DUF7352 domain-containing protein n=1 Tax=Desulfogranum japonicum TaxID=231447 RepID=UPI0004126414|nr:hypothetical protein [Desulfogranum japonicum]